MAADDIAVLYDDCGLLVVNKPAGLLVHRSALDAHADDDLVSRLRRQLDAPVWPLHRLDKGTSGVLALARSGAVAAALQSAWHGDRVQKQYLALVRGWPPEQGQTDQPLARDPELSSRGQALLAASTRWQVLQRLDLPLQTQPAFVSTRLALVQLSPLSGRRHQIRRHFKQLGHPLVGDATHGKGPLNRALAEHLGLSRLWLHAWQLSLPHPQTGEAVRLQANPPADWAQALTQALARAQAQAQAHGGAAAAKGPADHAGAAA